MSAPKQRNARGQRYEIYVERANRDQREMIQCNGRRIDAMRRARFVAADRKGWPTINKVAVLDTWTAEWIDFPRETAQ